MEDNDIVLVKIVNNANVTNFHHNITFPCNLIILKLRNGKERIIDLNAEVEITNVDYLKYEYVKRTREKILFEEYATMFKYAEKEN